MALRPDFEQRLDSYAEQAREEFEANWKEWTGRDVADLWVKWCDFGKTNHDRLGRILWEVTGAKPKPKKFGTIRIPRKSEEFVR